MNKQTAALLNLLSQVRLKTGMDAQRSISCRQQLMPDAPSPSVHPFNYPVPHTIHTDVYGIFRHEQQLSAAVTVESSQQDTNIIISNQGQRYKF